MTNIKKILVLCFAVITHACVINIGGGENGDVSGIFGSVSVSEGKRVGDVSSVNGNIELADSVVAQQVDTVNGNIELGDYVSIQWANTVNGNIEAGKNLTSYGELNTTNGDIDIGVGSKIEGNIETVNGDIRLPNANVLGDVSTHTGDINLTSNTSVAGNIVFHEKGNTENWFGNSNKPTLRIDNTVTVAGNIILERPVTLELANETLKAKVISNYAK